MIKKTESKRHWETIKHTNISITGIPSEEEKEKRAERICKEIIVENLQISQDTILHT